MRQAIITKYMGPTNFRGSRVKATAEAGSITIDWNDALNVGGNHLEAAKALQAKFGWTDDLTGGSYKKGYVFVQIERGVRYGR